MDIIHTAILFHKHYSCSKC